MTTNLIAAQTCIVRGTDAKRGRTRSVAPGDTASRYLHYGRIILAAGDEPVAFPTGHHETGLICLKGRAVVGVDGTAHTLVPYDAVYVPRDSAVRVAAEADGCDLAELSAPVANRYPARFVSFREIQQDPGLHFKTGGPNAERVINILIGKNVEAGRIVAGVTFSAAGNWTSWPPHEHTQLLEEAYLYIDMPAPSFGVQFVYNDTQAPELATFVREGDVVIMPAGYHPNVATPGGQINFLWMMAANREREDRLFGVVNVQPEFASGGSGLEAGTK